MVANKSGVIKSMYVKKGLPQVRVNDFVEKGKILVSGAIEKLNMEKTKEEENEEVYYEYLASEGEVIATTWYRAEVLIPLQSEHIELTGNIDENYRFGIGSYTFPIWPWNKKEFDDEIKEIDEKKLEIFGWEFPLYIVKEKRMESTSKITERTREQAIEAGIQQAKEDLYRKLGNDARIISEKVLHETNRHGKVKLSLYITVEENIAIEQPINQGD